MCAEVLRIIGDIHNHYDSYFRLIKYQTLSVQLGDLAFEYDTLRQAKVNPDQHVFIGGNHENYQELLGDPPPNYLGDFGTKKLGNFEFFFVRGSLSINKKKSDHWSPQEELTEEQCVDCLNLYRKLKPNFILSHTCPWQLIPEVATKNLWFILNYYEIDPSNNRTERLLQDMFESHQPKLWIFGHHHRSWKKDVSGCRFICLDKYGHVDISEKHMDFF